MGDDVNRESERRTEVDRPVPTAQIPLSSGLARRRQEDEIRIEELKRLAAG